MMQKYPVRAADVAYRVIDGEAVLVTAKGGTIYSLNPVGSKVWELADGTKTISEIIAEICSCFEVSEEQAYTDVAEFVGSLVNKKVISLKDKEGAA